MTRSCSAWNRSPGGSLASTCVIGDARCHFAGSSSYEAVGAGARGERDRRAGAAGGAAVVLELRNVGGDRDQRRHVGAGRESSHADPLGIDAELVGVRPQVGQRAEGVLRLRRIDRVRDQSVVDVGDHVAGAREAVRDLVGLVPRAVPPAAAVDEEDRGCGRGAHRGVDVHHVVLVAFVVGVSRDLDVATTRAESEQTQERRAHCAASEQAGCRRPGSGMRQVVTCASAVRQARIAGRRRGEPV
jgi:hypothetical protein